MSSTSMRSLGLGCLSVVGVIFVVLKLLSIEPVASWSWLWVLSPFWIGLAVEIVLLILVVPFLLLIAKILSSK